MHTNGSNKHLLDHGVINRSTYDKICMIWQDNLEYLLRREASLVHISAFPWNIHLLNGEGQYCVTGLGSIGDVMWWDPMYDVTNLLYPPFMDISDDERTSFIESYSFPIEEKAICIYRLFNRVLALADCFMAPIGTMHGEQWIQAKVGELNELIGMLHHG